MFEERYCWRRLRSTKKARFCRNHNLTEVININQEEYNKLILYEINQKGNFIFSLKTPSHHSFFVSPALSFPFFDLTKQKHEQQGSWNRNFILIWNWINPCIDICLLYLSFCYWYIFFSLIPITVSFWVSFIRFCFSNAFKPSWFPSLDKKMPHPHTTCVQKNADFSK